MSSFILTTNSSILKFKVFLKEDFWSKVERSQFLRNEEKDRKNLGAKLNLPKTVIRQREREREREIPKLKWSKKKILDRFRSRKLFVKILILKAENFLSFSPASSTPNFISVFNFFTEGEIFTLGDAQCDQ